MILTIYTDQKPATDLGFRLRKNPDTKHADDFSFGRALTASL